MAKRSNPKLIGGFVLGAIALVVIGAFAFGGGNFLKPKAKAVLFFVNSSLSGLTVGAVTDLKIKYDVAGAELWIPVYIEIEREKFQIFNGERDENNILALVKRGLRAQLEVQSLVTGQVNVNFDFHPEIPARLVGTERDIMELPTAPSEMSELKASVAGLLNKINQLPLDKIVDEIKTVLESADTVLQTADGTLKGVGAQVKPLADSFRNTSDEADRLLTDVVVNLPHVLASAHQMM